MKQIFNLYYYAWTKYYLHLIYTINFSMLEGKEKWMAYKFTRNVYDI